jgi:hypothetical protein
MDSDIYLFISSTSDLRAEREALAHAEELRRSYRLFLYEDFGAGSDGRGNTSPEEILREILQKCDVFVCLLGPRYGSPYRPPEDMRSIVEWELQMAESRPGIEIMPFRKIVPEEEIEPRQREFINRLSAFGRGRWLEKFDSPQTLTTLVRKSMESWLARQYKGAQARVAPWLNRILFPFALALLLLCVLVALLFVLQILTASMTSLIGFAVIIFFTVLLGYVVLKSQTGEFGNVAGR